MKNSARKKPDNEPNIPRTKPFMGKAEMAKPANYLHCAALKAIFLAHFVIAGICKHLMFWHFSAFFSARIFLGP
ncbi:MAG: hypothetical protein VXU42_04425, partial [Verrucomicrobiota bacterium]|nr:hypothetical protein [Verrucomicrobiota bacterium]